MALYSFVLNVKAMMISVIVCDKIVFDKATLDLLVMAVSPLLHDVIVIVFDKSNS